MNFKFATVTYVAETKSAMFEQTPVEPKKINSMKNFKKLPVPPETTMKNTWKYHDTYIQHKKKSVMSHISLQDLAEIRKSDNSFLSGKTFPF